MIFTFHISKTYIKYTHISSHVLKNSSLIRTFTVLSIQHLHTTSGRSILKTTVFTVFSKPFSKRFMMSSRCLYATKAIYHSLYALTNNDVINNTTKTNHKPITESLVHFSMDIHKGIPQHKESVVTHMITQTFPVDDAFDTFSEYYPNIKWISVLPTLHHEKDSPAPNIVADARFMKELPIIKTYYEQFYEKIDWIIATNDSCPANFPHQKQTNQDFLVNLKANPTRVLDKALGLNYKVVPHDEKGGNGIFEHATRGTLGMICYDSNGQNIQITPKPIIITDILVYNNNRLKGIINGMKNDYMDITPYENILNECTDIIRKTNKNDYNEVFKTHNSIQKLLWDGLHCDHSYNRSISFVFLKQLSNQLPNAHEKAFHDRFIQLLPNKVYNLDQFGDTMMVTKAAVQAYKETIDPKIIEKLMHLNGSVDIKFNTSFLRSLAELFKASL